MGLNPVSSSGKAVYEDEMGLIAVSSSGKAVCEDEMGLIAVSSSGKAVCEDEMRPAEGSDTSTPIFVPDSKCRWGQGWSLSLSKGRPKPLIPGLTRNLPGKSAKRPVSHIFSRFGSSAGKAVFEDEIGRGDAAYAQTIPLLHAYYSLFTFVTKVSQLNDLGQFRIWKSFRVSRPEAFLSFISPPSQRTLDTLQDKKC
jgi:hypothetical protein